MPADSGGAVYFEVFLMAWIESHDTIWEHHKTIRLCRLLGIGRAQAVGHLHGLWHFVLRNAWRDADLTAWGDPEIERAAWWDGEKGVLVGALREAGFLDGFVVHDWLERAGRLVYDRARKEVHRKSAVKRRNGGGKSKATLPYRTLPNQTLPDPTTDTAEPGLDFEAFWTAYPNKVKKKDALRSWLKINPDAETVAKILAAVSTARSSDGWRKDGGKFIPHPTTWLNGRRWEDQIGGENGKVEGKFSEYGRIGKVL